MAKLVGLSGSLRAASFNTGLLRAAAELMPDGSSLTVATPEGIPVYNADLERDAGMPEAVERLKAEIIAADGLLLATPEYNNGVPGVLKNTIDWLSRPPSDMARVFAGRPVAVIGASPGGFGTILSQAAWLPILRHLGTRPWFGGRLMVSRAGSAFDEAGNLTSPETRKQLEAFLAGFVADIAG